MSDISEYLDFAKELAEEAGKIMTKYFGSKEFDLKTKNDQTPVTLADTDINSLVINNVKQRFPDHGVLGEEESFNLHSDFLWVVDPLDGTKNFAEGISQFAFSIALVEQGKLLAGLVYEPNVKRMFYASAGNGAYENGKRLHLIDELPELIKGDLWLTGGIQNSVWKDAAIADEANRIISSDSKFVDMKDWPVAYALALAGSGDFDATLSTIKTPWDVAAGCLIAQEAGAKVTDLYGATISRWDKEVDGILVAPPKIHAYILELLAPVLEGSK